MKARSFANHFALTQVVAVILALWTVSASAQTTWVQRTPATNPGPRAFHAMVYDSARHVCVLFGGRDGNNNRSGETWEYDGNTWTLRTFTGPTPSAREQFAMAYDSVRHVTVLFGGFDGGPTNGGRSGETWEYDGAAWTLRSSMGPSARAQHAMAFDSVRGVTVLACGNDIDFVNLNDTWEWDGSTWTVRQPQGATTFIGRDFPAMCFDTARGVTVLSAGTNGGITPPYDIQEWNGTSWTRRTDSFTVYGHCMVYDSLRQISLIAAGVGFLPVYVGEWNGLTLSANSQQTFPSGRAFGSMAFDSSRGVTVLYGGATLGSGNSLSDTWELVPCVKFIGHPATRSACPGSTTVMTVAVSAQGPVSYQWRKNGAPISAASNPSAVTFALVLSNVSSADAASYDCVATVNNCGFSTSNAASLTINCVPFASATPSDSARFVGNRPSPGEGAPQITYAFQSLLLGAGDLFGLGPTEVLNLDNGNGTLTVGVGGVFYGNGIILGNIYNAGLFIIPITRAAALNNTQGGVVRVSLPPSTPTAPVVVVPNAPPMIRQDTFADYGDAGFNPLAPAPQSLVLNTPQVTVQGTAAWDGELAVTGSFTQTPTGYLRLFIAGDVRGETYSRLQVGQGAALEGTLQIVLQPEIFDFVPSVGQSFDVIGATGGITLPAPPQSLQIKCLMTAAGAAHLGLTLPTFVSSFAADPNQLVTLPDDMFTFALADGGTTLRVTMASPVCVAPGTISDSFICPLLPSTTFVATPRGSGPFTYQWEFRGAAGVEPTDWIPLNNGQVFTAPGGTYLFDVSGAATAGVTLSRSSVWPQSGPGSNGELRVTIGGVCEPSVRSARFGVINVKCSPADIARDDGFPLPPFTGCVSLSMNSGINEGDYNCFFAADGFFYQASLGPSAIGDFCDIAFDDGEPLPPFSSSGSSANNGVNEGDYNCFFNNLFLPCV